MLTQDNRDDLERVQKSALKIILQDRYETYRKALAQLQIETLENRREELCLNFAQKCSKNEKMRKMFPLSSKTHNMNMRDQEKYQVQFAHTDRLKDSPVTYMQRLLNENEKPINKME